MDDMYSDSYEFDPKAAEIEHIEYLITSGEKMKEIYRLYPHISKQEIEKILKKVAWFCWGWIAEDFATDIDIKIINGKEYIIKSAFMSERDIKTAIIKLAERKAMQEMGLEMPLNAKLFDDSD
jgi:hypothetical protein